jgi:hypothetical protein
MRDIKSFIAELQQDGETATNIMLILKRYFGNHNIRFTYDKVEVDDDITAFFVAWVLPNGMPETAVIFDNEIPTDWWGEEIQ